MIASIPFFRPGSIDLGPVELQPFGILVALGVVLGVYLMRRWGETHGLDDDHVRGLVNWMLVCGFLGAHVFDVLAYQHDKLAEDPLLLFKVWQGISSYGGFISGAAGFFWYARRKGLHIGPYADAAMIALASGFTLGRLGCTVVHDHIGAGTDGFFLATYYSQEAILKYGFGSPPGTLAPGFYHNLGFYEFLYMLLLCALLYGLTRWKSRPPGFMAVAVATAYAPVRFFLDYLRVNRDADPRYIGLTFAQWMSLVLLLAGLYLLVRLLRGRGSELPAAVVAGSAGGRAAASASGRAGGGGAGAEKSAAAGRRKARQPRAKK